MQLGAHVRKGEKSTLVSFWKCSEYGRENANTGEVKNKTSVLLRYYHVFNIEQCDGLRAIYGDDFRPVNPIELCEAIADSMPNAPRIERNSHAFYRPSADLVGMPSRNCFESAEAYYTTLFHELIHSTGHSSRIGRFEENSTDHEFASESYSKEELIAEIGAAMLAGISGISHSTLANSASYLQSWINKLRSDSRLIISAASQAQKAVDHILGEGKAHQ
jgi:antirestriction protein ArdC